MFQAIAPNRPDITITRPWAPRPGLIVSETVVATSSEERADEVHHRCHRQRHPRGQRPGGDRRGDRVGGVVETVGVVEDEGNDDHRDDDRDLHQALSSP